MKKRVGIGLLLVACLVLFSFIALKLADKDDITGRALSVGDSSGVYRSFSSNNYVGQDITVTISVVVSDVFQHNVYLVEETIPAGFVLVDSGSASVSGDVLKWYNINDVGGVTSQDFTYIIRAASAGNYDFDGNYVFDGMDSVEPIAGSGSLSVGGLGDTAPVPDFSFTHPLNYSSTTNTNIDINWIDGDDIVEAFIEFNFDGTLKNVSGSSWSGVLDAGSYQWRAYARDSLGSWGVTSVQTFDIYKRNVGLSLTLNELEQDISVGTGSEVNILVFTTPSVDYDLYENGILVNSGVVGYNSEGQYNYTAIVPSDSNYNGGSITRFVSVSGVAFDFLITWNNSKWFNTTTDFSNVNVSNFSARFANAFGEIRFLDNISAARNLNLIDRVRVESKKIFVDSLNLYEFDLPAELIFYGITFTNPRILRNGAVCYSCDIKSYANQRLVVEVDGFSEYTVEETPTDDGSPSSGGSGGGGGGGTSTTEEVVGEVCHEDYSCGEWGKCIDGKITRVCVDLNGCSVDTAETKTCAAARVAGESIILEEEKEIFSWSWSSKHFKYFLILLVIVLAIVLSVFFLISKKNKRLISGTFS